ncbi:hypothetical protein [Brevibacillus laterosporus]|uniref:phage lytic cycle repressor MrpR family protein n=1 Tax=Brevibacillus laterosporus TaxID=1465 RepID=UPI00215BB183|nr:hypothetical protein [Brevibacillus laterosporus]MCR8994588.1 hypothetical protein [Brevibacillus laterosporus]
MTIEVFFNSSVKELFLNRFDNDDTKDVYSRIFKKSAEMEQKRNKDLYNFGEEDLAIFIENQLKPKTKESARTYCNVLSSYIQWSIDNNFSEHISNPIRRRQDYFYSFVQENKLYINVYEKDDILRELVNRQDGFIVQALWEGIQGTQVCELTGLKITDIDAVNNKISLRDGKGNITRVIDVEDKTIDMAILANKEEEYAKLNGNFDYHEKVKDFVALPKSDYILKSAKTNKDKEGKKVSHYTIYTRLEMMQKLDAFKEYSNALTSKNITRSGMIHMAYKLYKRDGEIGRKQIDEICEHYGIKYKWSLRDFLNADTVAELYPE